MTVVAPGHEPERGRPPEDADAPAARPRADARPTARSPTRSTARPTDAVSLAFLGYFGHGFDLVASGINYGANLGDDITYSGTVSAAMEAVINNCPAFAISQEYYEHPDFTLAGARPRRSSPATSSSTACRRGELHQRQRAGGRRSTSVDGFEVTRLGKRVYQDQLIERLDPRGIPYFWIGGPPPSGLAVAGHRLPRRRQPPHRGHADPPRPDRAAAAPAAAHLGLAGARRRWPPARAPSSSRAAGTRRAARPPRSRSGSATRSTVERR